MKSIFLNYFKSLMSFMLAFTLQAGGMSAEASNQSLVRLPGHVPTMAIAKSAFLENLDADYHVPMTFVLPLRNQEDLEKLVQRIYDPNDHHHYGKYLNTEEFIEKFAPSQEDYDKIIAYANNLGMTVSGTHPNRTLLNVTAPAKTIEDGFKLSLRQYQIKDGRKFYAPDNDPAVPVFVASLIRGVVGLDNLAVWRPYNHRKIDSGKLFNSKAISYPSGPGGGFAPNDLAIAYNLTGVSAKGSGQTIALFELASYHVSDITKYTNFFGLPNAKLTNILVDGGSRDGINAEVTLDIELALALAPESQIYVYEGPNTDQGVIDTYNRIATDNLAKQVSISWGLGEGLVPIQYLQAENAIFLQMAAHGQTVYAAAGDSGAYDNYPSRSLMVDDPASQPYVVGVGGTRLTVNPQSCAYESETVWNEGLGNGAGGGGISLIWPIPYWQTNVPNTYSKTNRNVPDISLNSDPNTGYSIYHNGQWQIYGGTSCAAPLWAAFTARVNQELMANQRQVLGFANPLFYSLGASVLSGTVFHDITLGDNLYYAARANYDNSTGWGSFNGLNLFTTLTQSSSTPPPPQLFPLLGISMTHSSTFKKGKKGTYQISVSNQGTGSTLGAVTVGISLPKGLTYDSFNGSGWVFNKKKLTFTQSSLLKSGASYPPITLSVNISKNAPSLVAPTATVSGGGSSSNTTIDSTKIK